MEQIRRAWLPVRQACILHLKFRHPSMIRPKILFVTGTDTGVGKTLLTALLVAHARSQGRVVRAIKPFCSGGRADAELLREVQQGVLTIDEINPFFFPDPLAPWVAACRSKRPAPSLTHVLHHIDRVASRMPARSQLLIEGVGGLMVPLGPDYTVRDLIAALGCEVLLVSANRLGTINHTLLSIHALQCERIAAPLRSRKVTHGEVGSSASSGLQAAAGAVPSASRLSRLVLMNAQKPDSSARSNPPFLAQILGLLPVVSVPFLGTKACTISAIERNQKKIQKTLARISD